jgi:hypothetical protein
MKIKLAFLLALISSAGLIAADAPADAPKGDAKKGEKGKKGAPQKPESVDEATWKKFLDASKAAQKDEAVVKAKEAKDEKAVREATKAAILKADASLESVFKALEEGRAKGGKKKKGEEPAAK